ncbi:class I SAM-dependent methyltransferase [Asanoa sp. NPDC049518]|uniref:class I SAM-dependent methyltransferase n=1 Tax=unclassified Asanoa TaxID=2685164 RepID=UPI003445972C
MIYQRPLAYLLALEGIALLRANAGDYDAEFGAARIDEIRQLLDDPALDTEPVAAGHTDTVTGYGIWSRTYDQPGNGLFDLERPVLREIVDPLPLGVALDAACGTGRLTEYLAERGHQVIGVDSSPHMLAHARNRLPDDDLREGDLTALPLGDNEVDLVVCALALTHLRDLGPVLKEFARVLRPDGHLVISDCHHELVALGSMPHVRLAGGEPAFLPAYRHRASDYLDAALAAGFTVRRCAEPRMRVAEPTAPSLDRETGPWDEWPWSLFALVPEAHRAVYDGTPALVIWHFELTG